MANGTNSNEHINGGGKPDFPNMLDAVDRLKDTGLNEDSAKEIVKLQYGFIESHLVTKDNLDISNLKIENKIDEMGFKVTIRMGALHGGSVALVLASILTMAKLGWLSIK